MTKELEIKKGEVAEVSGSPDELIKLALSGGADLDKLEKLLTIRERWEAGEAKKAYHAAMSAFKAEPPKIDKDKTVAYGNTKYNHASLANVCEKVNEALSRHGLSAAWTTKQDNGTITVICTITHVQGHSESTSLTAAPDSSGSKNSIQAIGSTISYLERYSLLSLTGLATYEQDDDAQGAVEVIDDKEKGQLLDMITDSGADIGKFLLWAKVESLDELPKSMFPKAVVALESKKNAKKAKAGVK